MFRIGAEFSRLHYRPQTIGALFKLRSSINDDDVAMDNRFADPCYRHNYRYNMYIN